DHAKDLAQRSLPSASTQATGASNLLMEQAFMSVQRYSPTRAFAVLGVLLGVALAASPARAVIVFSDDFESYAPDANILGGGSVCRPLDAARGSMKARTDTGPIFGAGNQYMEYVDDSTANHPGMSASFTPIVGQAARL